MNSGTEALRDAVLTDAKARAYSILQDAQKAVESGAGKIDADIATRKADALARADTDAARRRQQLMAEVESDLRRESLAFRESLIAEVVATAKKKLAAVSADREAYRPYLLALAIEGAQAISSEKVKLSLRAEDRPLADSAFIDALRSATGKWAEVAPESIRATGGLIIAGADGRERCDVTFDGRLERQMAEIRAAIWARMSHA